MGQINEPKWDAWKVLPEAVRTGQVAFALAHDGLDMHEVMHISPSPLRDCPHPVPLPCSLPHQVRAHSVARQLPCHLWALASHAMLTAMSVGVLQYDEVEGNEAFAEDFQQAMTYYTKQSLVGGDTGLQDAYDWRSAKVTFDLEMYSMICGRSYSLHAVWTC